MLNLFPWNLVMNFYKNEINNSKILRKLKINKNNYFLLTSHRQENVDSYIKLKSIIELLNDLIHLKKIPIIWPIHPRSKLRIKKMRLKLNKNIKLVPPVNFF